MRKGNLYHMPTTVVKISLHIPQTDQQSCALLFSAYCKVPIFWNTRNFCSSLPKIQEKRPNLWVFRQKDANGAANIGDPDQTAPRV